MPATHKLLRFIVVGTACALLFFSIHFLFLKFVGLPLMPATCLAYSICFGVGYILQRRITFRSRRAHSKALPKYFVLHLSGMIFVYFAARWIESSYNFGTLGASLGATAIAGIVSFVISLTWVFADPDDGAQPILERS